MEVLTDLWLTQALKALALINSRLAFPAPPMGDVFDFINLTYEM